MRILYHHRTLADGAEGIHIAEMVSAFRSLGHEVHVRSLAGAGRFAGAGEAGRVGSRACCRQPPSKSPPSPATCRIISMCAARFGPFAPTSCTSDMPVLTSAHLSAARHAGIPTVLEVNCLFTGAQYQQFEPVALERLGGAVRAPRAEPGGRGAGGLHAARARYRAHRADQGRGDPERRRSATVRSRQCADRARIRARYGLGEALTVGWAGVMRDWHGLELLLDAVAAHRWTCGCCSSAMGLPGRRVERPRR